MLRLSTSHFAHSGGRQAFVSGVGRGDLDKMSYLTSNNGKEYLGEVTGTLLQTALFRLKVDIQSRLRSLHDPPPLEVICE